VNEMTPFEEHLKEALARKEPSQEFANRVLEKTREQARPRTSVRVSWFRRAWAWRLAPAMAALALVWAGVMYQEHERTVRGELAKEKLLIAMRIAGSKLHDVQQHVMEIQYREVEP
jgi:hypothetical protein